MSLRSGRWLGLLVIAACASGDGAGPSPSSGDTSPHSSLQTDTSASVAPSGATGGTGSLAMTGWLGLTGCTGMPDATPGTLADVEEVSMSGGPAEWTVDVTVRSPDIDCDQYASWWEVVTPAGELVYRRILNHSHPDEQPFTRSGSGVPLDAGATYRVRAHLHPDGYGGQVLEGTPSGAFEVVDVEAGWASELANAEPLPTECWY